MGEIADQKLATMNSSRGFVGSFPTHPLPDILTKHNIKKSASRRNIWGPFYLPKGGGSGGGQTITKKVCHEKDVYINPDLNKLFRNVY